MNALIDHALLWKEPDPHVIARRLAHKIPDGERDAILDLLLADRVRSRIRSQRNGALSDELTNVAAQSSESPSARSRGHSKWTRLRYAVANEWKFRDDLTPDDVDWLADDHERRSVANARIAADFRRLAARMRAEGVARVGDLRGPPPELAT